MRRLPDYNLVKSMVRSLHEEYAIDHPPIDPLMIAQDKGLDVKFVRFSADFDGVSGFYDPSENAIYVNKEESPFRQTFTIAHELGHFMLHGEWAGSDEYKVFWRDPSRNSDDLHEKEANAFAAHLLMPRSLLNKFYEHLSPPDMARLFAVSVPAMKNRLSFEYGF